MAPNGYQSGLTALFLYIGLIMVSQKTTWAITAFDCSHQNLSYTKISLNNIEDCATAPIMTESSTIEMQLVQVLDEVPVKVNQCKLLVTRQITYCGMHHHSSSVKHGLQTYLHPLPREACSDIIRTGTYTHYRIHEAPIHLDGVKPGKSYQRTQTVVGAVDYEGHCRGGKFYDSFGSWDNVIVEATVRLQVNVIDGTFSPDVNILHVGGIKCPFKDKECHDSEAGDHYWSDIVLDHCKTLKHRVLYEGLGNVTTPVSIPTKKSAIPKPSASIQNSVHIGQIITVNTATHLFSFKVTNLKQVCYVTAYTTEHPKLLIFLKSGSKFIYGLEPTPAMSLDLFSYMNSKFLYMERNIAQNMNLLYNNLARQQCDLERSQLQLKLALAYTNPVEFAYVHYQSPGYTASRYGEVMYVSKCQPVLVRYRPTERCYHELPVLYKNESYFLSPKTHLLTRHGQEIACNVIFPPMYEVDNVWYTVTGRMVKTTEPEVLGPHKGLAWNFEEPLNLVTGGIYSSSDLEELRQHIMYGSERAAIENVLVRSFSGLDPDLQGGSTSNMLDEDALGSLAEKIGERLWGFFATFGNITSGLFGIYMIARIVKWLIDTLIHGAMLYEVYGFSVWLIGSIWDSVTNWSLHRKRHTYYKPPWQRNADDGDDEDPGANPSTELTTVVTSKPDLTKAKSSPQDDGTQTDSPLRTSDYLAPSSPPDIGYNYPRPSKYPVIHY